MDQSTVRLVAGANAPLAKGAQSAFVTVTWEHAPAELDVSCFMVGGDGKVPSDDYFVFYNQPADPLRSVQFRQEGANRAVFEIRLADLSTAGIERCVFAATLDGPGSFAGVSGCKVTAAAGGSEVVYEVKDGGAETSLVLAELYKHKEDYKLRAIGRGFHGGLKPLAEAHGVEVEDSEDEASDGAASSPSVPPVADTGSATAGATGQQPAGDTGQFAGGTRPSAGEDPVGGSLASGSVAGGSPAGGYTPMQANVPPAQAGGPNGASSAAPLAGGPAGSGAGQDPQPPKLNLTKIDLLKSKVAISLRKKNIEHEKARVAVVFDASGSMSMLYNKGVVQRAFERVLAVAACLDDDGVMDVWFFATKSKRAPSVNEHQYEDYVKRTYPGPKMFGGLGVGNNEPVVMADVIKKYTKESPSALPTYIIFFSDGGIYETKKISKLLVDSSGSNLFWQFVGIGNADYGVLRQLDDLRGRVLDNADFFALDDMDRVSDEELYDRLFDEYPKWLNEARRMGIVRS
ncbi:VWA domain-containing protein [Paenibacillus sp. CN-4]|uniref:vWA domain-containing protein n=1 Tax=Paenibacillus nanchangensis TaxID=3348343 RepID=UPI00397C7A27